MPIYLQRNIAALEAHHHSRQRLEDGLSGEPGPAAGQGFQGAASVAPQAL
ncbi:hypothetical protein [Reticulibacter mediterranei]|nr:hypothetical protein [Reticulibacter mediterranei]